MRSKKKINLAFFKSIKGFFKKLFFSFVVLVYRIKKSLSLMNKLERVLAGLFLVLFLVLLSIKIVRVYRDNTIIVPAPGGVYAESVYGEFKYLNPILVSSDAEKSISKLVFSSLVRVTKDNQVEADVAKSWSISPDNTKYTFVLRDDVYFHDGEKLTADDVAYTINLIKDPDLKSPLLDKWKDVAVEAGEDNSITMTLPKAYGAFLYNCDFGILPSHVDLDSLNRKFVGSGPYQYDSVEKTAEAIGSRTSELSLKKNDSYFKGSPYINELKFTFYQKKDEASKSYVKQGSHALSAVKLTDEDDSQNLSFKTEKRLALIFNLRKDSLAKKEVREEIVKGQKFDTSLVLTLTTLDNEVQKQKAEELKSNFAANNIILNVRYLTPVELKTALDNKDFELLLYGFDFGHDRDPYAFWHSTQLNKNNFAGYGDKNSDILLEDARMTVDPVERNKKYDQFMQVIQSEFLAVFYDPIDYNFYINEKVHGVSKSLINDVSMKYYGIEGWYIKEKRIKK